VLGAHYFKYYCYVLGTFIVAYLFIHFIAYRLVSVSRIVSSSFRV